MHKYYIDIDHFYGTSNNSATALTVFFILRSARSCPAVKNATGLAQTLTRARSNRSDIRDAATVQSDL